MFGFIKKRLNRGFIGRNKFRFVRGQGYISAINTILLLGLAFHINNLALIILTGILTLVAVWAIGYADDKFKVVHAEQYYSVEQANPYFLEMKKDIVEIKRMLKRNV